jgi:hypothetical protein
VSGDRRDQGFQQQTSSTELRHALRQQAFLHSDFLGPYAGSSRVIKSPLRPVVTVRRHNDIFRAMFVSSARENLPVAEPAQAS